MKLAAKFKPLILSTQKQYEFRNSGEHFDTCYQLDNQTFYLESYKMFPKDKTKLVSENKKYFVQNTVTNSKLEITELEYLWLQDNFGKYFQDWIFIGRWIKTDAKLGTIEIIN